MRRLTKTFVENRWYRRLSPGQFEEIPKAETNEGPAIDEQVQTWVDQTGHIIIHPGQIGMHTTWHGNNDDPYQLRCVTLGLTVLYQEVSNAGGNPAPAPAAPIAYGGEPGGDAPYPSADPPG